MGGITCGNAWDGCQVHGFIWRDWLVGFCGFICFAMAFCGYKPYFRLTILTLGIVYGAAIIGGGTFYLIDSFADYTDVRKKNLTLIACVVGALAGCIFFSYYKTASHIAVGFTGGAVFMLMILNFLLEPPEVGYRVILILLMGAIGGLICHKYEREGIIGSTAFFGSAGFVVMVAWLTRDFPEGLDLPWHTTTSIPYWITLFVLIGLSTYAQLKFSKPVSAFDDIFQEKWSTNDDFEITDANSTFTPPSGKNRIPQPGEAEHGRTNPKEYV